MYSYTYDKQTGGIILNSSPTGFSKEPRPVYAWELDTLGFDKIWKYDKQNDLPYMWAEANCYYYRGDLVARIKGGNIYTVPEITIPTQEDGTPVQPEPHGISLRPINITAMVESNRKMIEIIEQTTVKKILKIYTKYKDKVDSFHVAFSGGKDSCVLLELVKKALPKGSFVTIFGDTGMEFPDTYEVINKTKQKCAKSGIPFYIASSHLDPENTWKLFGPPSRVLRWCCSVHKSTPQTLKLREITGKDNYVGLDFVGVRAHESIGRSKYKYENYGAKQKGQFSHNSILEWTSAEIWIYIFAKNILINEAYKKGNSRAGCLFCPMSGGAGDFLRRSSYPDELDKYVEIIKSTYDSDRRKDGHVESYILNGGWNSRKNGREILDNPFRCMEKITNGYLTITVINPDSDWMEWIKTIGDLHGSKDDYSVIIDNERIRFSIKMNKNGYVVKISEAILKEKPLLRKLFRQVFRKAAYCKGCRVCETNCKYGCISFANGKVNITNCVRCHQCHEIDSGCLIFHSLRHPQGGGTPMKSLNSFADHAPKTDWLRSFFELKDSFFTEHTLGPMMYDMFRRFLKDAHLNEKNHFTPFAELISKIGWATDVAQGLILVNLVSENPQLEWFVRNFDIGINYSRNTVESMLIAVDVKPKDAKSIAKSFKRLVETPLGTSLHWGYVTEEENFVRTKCSVSNSLVVLYSLYKFAEDCNNHKEFTLTTLLNDDIDRDGISPSRIFGLVRNEIIPILLGLSAKYPDFIVVSFTHDLDKITLSEDKSSKDVLFLFEGDTSNAN